MVDVTDSQTLYICIRLTSLDIVVRPVIIHVNLYDEHLNRKE